jgi:hypothetical protein
VLIDDAHFGRLVDIPLPRKGHGLYEDLHEFSSGENLSDALQGLSRRYFGTAGRQFVRKLVGALGADKEDVKSFLKKQRSRYKQALRKAVKANGLKPLKRASDRFATTFASGCLAARFDIVPWGRKELLRAILSCQLDQVRSDAEETDGAVKGQSMRTKLIKYLEKYKNACMNLKAQRPRHGRDDINAVPGYREKVSGQRWFYLTAKQLDAIIGTGVDARQLKQGLVTEGLLAQKTIGKFVVQRRIFEAGKRNQNYAWVHAIKADILAEQAAKGDY